MPKAIFYLLKGTRGFGLQCTFHPEAIGRELELGAMSRIPASVRAASAKKLTP